MCKVAKSLTRPLHHVRRFWASPTRTGSLSPVNTINTTQENGVDVEEFRQRAFIPEKPAVISKASKLGMPAATKWFSLDHRGHVVPSQQYLKPFGATILPYELTTRSGQADIQSSIRRPQPQQAIYDSLSQVLEHSSGGTFHRFNAPLSLFLQACKWNPGSPGLPQLYIAQAQIADLPRQLQDDLPTPEVVTAAGKGDVYDANVWLGIPPTYTPLHKDPNPNLFVQLAGRKQVRLFTPVIGARIFGDVQQMIGRSSPSALRGEEMMEGPERSALDNAVWGHKATREEGYEVIVGPGDSLFIPKGWWHSFKSMGTDVTASANWWFR